LAYLLIIVLIGVGAFFYLQQDNGEVGKEETPIKVEESKVSEAANNET